MFTHNFEPVLFDLGYLSLRWYSLAYIFGILIGWWYGKKIIVKKFKIYENKLNIDQFDEYITYLILAIIIGGRLGYVLFYNFYFYLENPFEILKIWKGGMSFHGAVLGIIIGTYFFSYKKNIKNFILLDIVACVSPIGIFLGRIANFINSELVGKATNLPWSVIFPNVDMIPRHPSQLYEAFLEGLVLFIILNIIIYKKDYKVGTCSFMFLILYGLLRITSEIFREPDEQIGLIFSYFSMGTILSFFMIILGLFIMSLLKKKNEI